MTRRYNAQVIHIFAMYLRRPLLCASQQAADAGSLRLQSRGRGVSCLFAAVLCLSVQPANANQRDIDNQKLYLHSRLVSDKQYRCAVLVAHKESRWNYQARNGSHHGLFQMRNKRVQYMNPYMQIDWWIRYIHTRYQGQACKALAHMKSKGWQ